MAMKEHKFLSDFIKEVHKDLRNKTNVMGAEAAWRQHCENKKKLEEYAYAMKELSCKYWDINSKKDLKVVSRVQWSYEFCDKYFKEIGKYRDKEAAVANKIGIETDSGSFLSTNDENIKLLDVGSCYNPFKQYDCFDITAIDIAPANREVFKCDFLNLQITNKDVIREEEIMEMQKHSFHVVVFSLFLEYIPAPEQRRYCCKKAYDLLKTEGILIIITPDSKHVGANAKLMKSWRCILAEMGFNRIKYEKLPYIHCMVFRKALRSEITERWLEVHINQKTFVQMNIPQDFKNDESKSKVVECIIDHNKEIDADFNEELMNCFNL